MLNEEYMNFKRMHYMSLLGLCSILMAPVVYAFSPWLNTFVMLKNTKKGSWLVVPRLSSIFCFLVIY